MKDDISELARDWEDLVTECLKLAYVARAIELQQGAIERLDEFAKLLKARKRETQQAGDEDEANLLLASLCVLQTVRSELAMFVALKKDCADDAWDHLVSAQNAASAALAAHHRMRGEFEEYSERLYTHEQNLFPPQIFVSPAMTVGCSVCSICEAAYGECHHVAGLPYMGEFCTRVISEVTEVTEISIVDHPKDKRRRMLFASGPNGSSRDLMTGRVTTTESTNS